MRAAGNTALVVAVAVALIFLLTDGLNAFTSEGARRYRIAQQPLTLPFVQLTDAYGETFHIQDFHDRTLLIDFIFTHCADTCPVMTRRFLEVQKQLRARQLHERVTLLTVSFDPARDTPEVLRNYAAATGGDAATWKFATVRDRQQLQTMLDAFGIVVIPTKNGQFEHNGAIHRVEPGGSLSRIYDYESIELILRDIEEAHGDHQQRRRY